MANEPMNTRDPQALLDKLKTLSPERRAEVEAFVDFLRVQEQDRALSRSALRVAEPAFAEVWNNDEDAVYDRL
jgi:hypothetical protein